MFEKVLLAMTGYAWVCLFVSVSILRPAFAIGGEFTPDANTLFLAHYNTSLDADYSQGPAEHHPIDTCYLTKNNGGYFGEGLAGRVGAEALKEAGADIKDSSLIPAKAFDGIRYPSPGNLDLAKGTFECWYKPCFSIKRVENLPKDWPIQYHIFAYRESAPSYLSLGINSYGEPGTGNLFFFVTKGGGAVCIQPAFNWKPGTWHHVAITWDATQEPGKITLFVDGQLAQSQPLSALKGGFLKQSSQFPYFSIGSPLWRRSADPRQFGKADGIIDEVRISNIARYTESFKLPEKPQPAAAQK